MNSFIWRKKNITGGTGGSLTSLSADLNANSHKITNLGAPSNNNDAATKTYVDTNKYGDTFVKVYHNDNTANVNNTTWTQVTDYTNMLNSFRVENDCVYELLIKQNTGSKDIYSSILIATHVANYDNVAPALFLPWDMPETDSIWFAVGLKNNQIKIWAKRGSSSTGTWNTATDIFARKVGRINFS